MPSVPTQIPDIIPTLEPDIPADSFPVLHLWLWLLIGSAVLLAVALIGFLLWRAARRRAQVPALSPLAQALQALDALEQELPNLRAGALQLSLLLRSYLAGQTQDPSLYETQEEFSQRMDSLEHVPESCRYATRELLEELASYKYAGEQLNDSMRMKALIDRSRQLLQELDSAAAQEKGGAA